MSMSIPSDTSGQDGQPQPSQPEGVPPNFPQPHMVASIFAPFNLAPANAIFPVDRDDKLRSIISNLEKHHDSVRRNMLFLTQCRAERLMNDAKEEIKKLQAEEDARGKTEQEKEAEEEARKRNAQELKTALANMIKNVKIRPKQGSSSSKIGESELGTSFSSVVSSTSAPTSTSTVTSLPTGPPQSLRGQVQSPLNTAAPILDTLMTGIHNNSSSAPSPAHLTASPTTISPLDSTTPISSAASQRTTYTILRDLDNAIRTLIDQSTRDLEGYDAHAKSTVDFYRQALERGAGSRQTGATTGRRMS
ncbi:hypothetical protein B7463_g2937, partial [Scytalidium lignicola]